MRSLISVLGKSDINLRPIMPALTTFVIRLANGANTVTSFIAESRDRKFKYHIDALISRDTFIQLDSHLFNSQDNFYENLKN